MNLVLLAIVASAAPQPKDEAKELARTLELSRVLKNLTDEEWSGIAGTKVSERVSIARGDTLYDISKRMFGDGKYWPKIWALNQTAVTNPHLIFPGQVIAFESGSLSSLPNMSVMSDASTSMVGGGGLRRTGRSGEWKALPRQRWEQVRLKSSAEVDPLGFDKNSKIVFRRSDGRRAPFFVSTETLPTYGTLEASDHQGGLNSTLDDQIFVQGTAALPIGKRFSITEAPISLGGGYAYRHLATVVIKQALGSGLYAAEILDNAQGMRQGSVIVDEFKKLTDLTPVAAPSDVIARLSVDPLLAGSYAAEHSWVFFDRGTADGITPGMVFRHYLQEDSETGRPLPENRTTRDADFQVLQSGEHISLAVGIFSRNQIKQGSSLVALRDVSDLLGRGGQDPTPVQTLEGNDLDNLDGPSDLSDSEKQELEQLENHQDGPAPETQLESPNDDLLDAPPAETAPAPDSELPPPAETAPAPTEPDPFLEE